MRYLSVCSGIEAASVAWHQLGWTPVAFSEIDAFPRAVLAHHYPDVPNWGDMTKFKEWPDATIDVLVGGTPCQSFSVAGLRAGLDDPRGNLMLVYLTLARRYRPRWLVWENVPGVLSSNEGRDFGTGRLRIGHATPERHEGALRDLWRASDADEPIGAVSWLPLKGARRDAAEGASRVSLWSGGDEAQPQRLLQSLQRTAASGSDQRETSHAGGGMMSDFPWPSTAQAVDARGVGLRFTANRPAFASERGGEGQPQGVIHGLLLQRVERRHPAGLQPLSSVSLTDVDVARANGREGVKRRASLTSAAHAIQSRFCHIQTITEAVGICQQETAQEAA